MKTVMKKMTKTAAVAFGAAVLMASPASAQVTSIDQLLQDVRNNSAQTAADNAQREAVFKERRDQQARLLREARSELATLERQASTVQATFDANERRVKALDAELTLAQGEFRNVFGLARTKASEFKATLDSSLISAEYDTRTVVLGDVAGSKALPDSDQLNAIWLVMLEEIKYQREVKTFKAPVNNYNDGKPVEITRVGAFDVFIKDNSNFLEYSIPVEKGVFALTALPRQPGGKITKAANAVSSASAGELTFGPVDPTRGSLLKTFEQRATKMERFQQGGFIGKIIAGLFIAGMLLGLFKLLSMFGATAAMNKQKKTAQASSKNPLGRIMMAYDAAKDKDEEIVELRLDEAILRESPKLERGLNFLKLGAGIAPLLGLLGTVTGMIKTFQGMMIFGTGNPQTMAGGISEALVTTMLGLIAAIPLLIMHSFSSSMARSMQNTLEEQSAGIIARHVENRRG